LLLGSEGKMLEVSAARKDGGEKISFLPGPKF
jgi:hypothetical protein